jgi:NADH dehydrogenase
LYVFGNAALGLFISRLISALTAAAVGTVQVRSLIEPLRKVIARLRGHFIYGKAVDLVMSERLLEVETISSSGDSRRIYLP